MVCALFSCSSPAGEVLVREKRFFHLHKAESAKFEAEQLTQPTDSVVIPEPWKQIFPP